MRCSTSVVALERDHERDRGDRADRRQDVRDDVVLEVDQRDRDEQQHEDQRQPDVAVGAEAQDARGAQQARQGLDDRVLGRDRRPARAALAAQPQPAEDRHVVVGLDRRPARGARRRRVRQGLAARQPVGHHVQEGADDRSEDRGQHGRHTDAHRACSVADREGIDAPCLYGRSAIARPAATVRRPASTSSGPAMTRASSGRRSCLAETLDEAGDRDRGAGDDAQLDRLGRRPGCGRSSARCGCCRRARARRPRAPCASRRSAPRRPRCRPAARRGRRGSSTPARARA